MVVIITSEVFLDHDTGPTHPECSARLTAIAAALRKMPGANYLHWRSPNPDRDLLPHLLRCHTPSYLKRLQTLAQTGGGWLDADTPVSPRSYEAASLAVAAWLDGVDSVLQGPHPDPVFVLARPPGHHALADQGMGFCLLNNAAIAAYYALEHPAIHRVAILDWDVHHGNGTEALIAPSPHLFYCSLHQFPAYPGTGQAEDQGDHHNVLNIPLPPGCDRTRYDQAFQTQVLPFLQKAQPDLLLVSAGYDATQADPLAAMNLLPADYGHFSHYLPEICPRILLGLEGGYHLEALAQSVVATVKALLH